MKTSSEGFQQCYNAQTRRTRTDTRDVVRTGLRRNCGINRELKRSTGIAIPRRGASVRGWGSGGRAERGA